MCPACLATAAWILGSVASTAGLTAIAIRSVGGKDSRNPAPTHPTEDRHDNHHHGN